MRMAWALVAIAALSTTACGWIEEKTKKFEVRQVSTWDVGNDLKAKKAIIVQACREAGADQQRTALVLAMAMQETTHCDTCQRDASKDGAGDARNVSAYNMNIYALKLIGCADRADALNDNANLGEATKVLLRGINQLGEDGFMNLHRGGQTALEDGHSYGAADYRKQMREVQARLLAEPRLMTSGDRVGGALDHV